MPDVALGYASPPSTRGTHRSDELNVNKLAERILLAVVPPSMVHPLSQDFDWWLCAICFLSGHIEVVDEYDACHPQGRAKHALAALVQLRIDNVLRLSRGVMEHGRIPFNFGCHPSQHLSKFKQKGDIFWCSAP